MAKQKRDIFAVDWSKAAISENEFTDWLRTEIQNAQDARASYVAEGGWLDLFHLLYEQAQMDRIGPWPNSANLTSWIGTVQVDALSARVAQAICGVEPLCTVTGWGKTSEHTAKVESFHEWQAGDEYLREHLEDAIDLALIEGTIGLEVDEKAVMRHTRRVIKAKPRTDEFGGVMLNDKLEPELERDDNDMLIEVENDTDPSVDVVIEDRVFACNGPQYRVLGGKDFLILPGHARNETEIWGYAKRFYLRPVELKQRAEAGTYQNIDQLAISVSDRDQRQDETRRGITIEPQQDQTVQKEFWEVQLCYDIDGDGADEWLIATISVKDCVLMRLEYDQLKQMRMVPFCPFPNPTWVYGMGLVQKLITTIFEHTAYRNSMADRNAMAVSAPLSRLTQAYWNPDEQPIGPQSVIDVRSHDEIRQIQVADVPQSSVYLKRDVEAAAERIGGLNDQSVVGVNPEGAPPSATQIQTTSTASAIRVDKVTRRLRRSVARVYDIRHEILKRQLQSNGEKGMAVPDDVLMGMQSRGVSVPTEGPFAITAKDLDGKWMFKPKGSVQSSDKRFLLQNLNGLMQTIGQLAQMSPQLAANMQQNPEVVKAFLDNALYIFDVSERGKILDALTKAPVGTQPSPMGPQGQPAPGQPQPQQGPPQGGIPPQIAQMMQAQQGGAQGA